MSRRAGHSSRLVLVSHLLCPYVQRAAIVLAEKSVPFVRRDIDLSAKPQWFLEVSPLGKTPVLLVESGSGDGDAEAIFESAVICEYLDETELPRLHPTNPLRRARHRSWMEFGSAMLNDIGAFYIAADAETHARTRSRLLDRLGMVEQEVSEVGPWFSGDAFAMVDAVFAPVFRYFDAFEALGEDSFFHDFPKARRWRSALAGRDSVRRAVAPEFPQQLIAFLLKKQSMLAEKGRAMRPVR